MSSAMGANLNDDRISVTQTMLRALTPAQRDLLLAHVSGPRPVMVGATSNTDKAHAVFAVLIRRGLIRGEPFGSPRPRASVLTDLGRATVAHILAEYADALVAAGFLESAPDMRPIEVLRAIKHRWRSASVGGENSPQMSGHLARKMI